jgi:hypothetical protein
MKKYYVFILTLLFVPFLSIFGQVNNSVFVNNELWAQNGNFIYFGSPDYGFTNQITVAAWVKWTINPTANNNVHEGESKWATLVTMDGYIYRDQGQFWLQHASSDLNFQWSVKTTVRKDSISSTTRPVINKWYYVVGTYDGSNMKLYINGVQENSKSLTGNINPYNSDFKFNIGRIANGYRLFTGNIDEVRIFITALTQEQIIQQMYSKSSITIPTPSDLVSYWSLDETSGYVVNDQGSKNVPGIFCEALVDVHDVGFTQGGSFSNTSGNIWVYDWDKTWTVNAWQGRTILTIAGSGFGQTNTVSSNGTNQLFLTNLMVPNPKVDDLGFQTANGMTWMGIQAATNSTSQWGTSYAPIGSSGIFANTNTQDYIIGDDAGARTTVRITSTPNGNNFLYISVNGLKDAGAITTSSGETYPSTITKRSNITWTVAEFGTVTSNVTINYSTLGGIGGTSLIRLLKRTVGTSTWTEATDFTPNNGTYTGTFTKTGAVDFYEYAIGTDNNSPMPIELTSFTSTVKENNVFLNWITSSETNNQGFEIQRFENNKWISSGFVQGKGTTSTPSTYSYSDKNLQKGIYEYRLKQIDYNGNFEYHVLNTDVIVGIPSKFELSQNYPNPFNPVTKINYELPFDSKLKLIVYDASGREIKTLVNETLSAGYYTVQFDATNFSSGVYFYRINANANGNEYVSTKKMLLIK